MKKLFIIDGHNVLFRSYYAIRGMTNPQGESTNALYGFIRTIYKLINDFSPSHLVTVFDGPEGKKSREKIYADYKAHRKGMPEDLYPQLGRAEQFCEIAGIPCLTITGVEGDDTMGSVAVWAAKKGGEVYLCSSDKDLCQLVTDNIFLLQLHKNNLILDRKMVKELYGIHPEQMIDYLALVGDTSDNIPGLEGFGPKTVSTLLQKFGTLDKILANFDKVPGKKKQEVLKTGKEVAHMSRALATLNLGVDFPKKEDFFALKTPDMGKVSAFYQEMHFLTLLKELDTSGVSEDEQPAPKAKGKEEPTRYTLVDDEAALEKLEALLLKQTHVCLDTETTDIRPMYAKLVGVGFGFKPKQAWYVPANGKLEKKRLLEMLETLFSSSALSFYGHNIKYDLHVLANEGLEAPRISFDTMVASYVLRPEQKRHNLDILSLEHFSFVKTSIESLIGKGKHQLSMDLVPLKNVSDYCCEDVDFTCRLKELFEKELKNRELTSVLLDIEVPLIPVLCKMERAGIHLDKKQMERLSVEFSEKIHEIESAIFKLAKEKFNLNSPKQLSDILFKKLGIHPPKKTQTGFSTAAGVLESIQDKHPIIGKIIEYRGFEKLRSTYVDALPGQVFAPTDRIHCTFNQSVAATGRLSCQDPNLQNIPARSKEGRKIRKAFKPQKQGTSFLSLDYSQVELRLLAHLCDDPTLIKAFRAGEDIHATTAAAVFNIPLKDVTKEIRHKAKAVNFGILYGQGAFGLAQSLAIEYREAAAFIETYFTRFSRVKEYIEFCKESVRKTGRAVTMLRRERPIPEITSKNPQIRAAAERLAINTPLQGTAADLIKLAMIDVDALLVKHTDWGALILQVHDELIFESPDTHIHALSKQVKTIMEGVIELKVPLTVDISFGKNWEEC